MSNRTVAAKIEKIIWEKLGSDKRVTSLASDMATIIYKALKEIEIPSLKKKSRTNFTYRKTEEWQEACAIAKKVLVRLVENAEGHFLDEEFKDVG